MNTNPYGDPDLTCLTGEQTTTINGIDGHFCSPQCPNSLDSECPTPSDSTATPYCILYSGTPSGTPCTTDADCPVGENCPTTGTCEPDTTGCALVCDPPGTSGGFGACAFGATCHDTGSGFGLCTWPI